MTECAVEIGAPSVVPLNAEAPADSEGRESCVDAENSEALQEALSEALGRKGGDPPVSPPQLPELRFDPSILTDSELPSSFESPMVDAVRGLLTCYSGQQSHKNALARLQDPAWRNAWDKAIAACVGDSVLLCGSELGTFAARALEHGATQVYAVERFALDGRISSGIVQKHLLQRWHAIYRDSIDSWSDEEKQKSFEEFASNVDVLPPDSQRLEQVCCDSFIFPNLDHSLLGTGIVRAVREHRGKGLAAHARILPARARIHAMAIEWDYSGSEYDLRPMDRFRWSVFPEALELRKTGWRALTAPACVGDLDFEAFEETRWDTELRVVADGHVDAIIYWFDLELDGARISNAPDGNLNCIKPAVQYVDSMAVDAGSSMAISVQVEETRLLFQPDKPIVQPRKKILPSWYVPMLLDKRRNNAYRMALRDAITPGGDGVVLDIGAGCGLLSMAAAEAGAQTVIGCEVSEDLAEVGNEIVGLNALESRITIVNKDCRTLSVPRDVPEKANLAVFEMFDCSLIGEGVLHFLKYAREHLLADDAVFLPRSGVLRAMLIEHRLDRVLDVGASILNAYLYTPGFVNVDASELGHRPLSEPFDVFTFDFANAEPVADDCEPDVVAIDEGTVGGVLFWFDLELDDVRTLSNAPNRGGGLHWNQGLQFLPEVRVSRGESLPLLGRHDGSSLSFSWDRDRVDPDACSSIPRFDPRCFAAISELEERTQGLLNHCRWNPEDYRKVAELAARIGADPGAHGIDPVIARRFSGAFFGV